MATYQKNGEPQLLAEVPDTFKDIPGGGWDAKGPDYFASPNAAWASLAACSIWASSMMTAILISEVEII